MIVRPKHFTLEPRESQMFRVSVPNRYCGEAPTEVSLQFDSNGGEAGVKIGVPPAGEVLLALEPAVVDLGEVRPGELREARLRLSFRGEGVPKFDVEADQPWLQVRPLSLPRRTQYYRLTARAPETPGPVIGEVRARAGKAAVATLVTMRVADP